MAGGVPVLAWIQAGPTVTVVAGTGYLAEPLEVADFARDIASLLDDPAANQAMGERAFEWARRFDWERHLDILERCIVDVARSHEQVAAEAATAWNSCRRSFPAKRRRIGGSTIESPPQWKASPKTRAW